MTSTDQYFREKMKPIKRRHLCPVCTSHETWEDVQQVPGKPKIYRLYCARCNHLIKEWTE